jgi:hypothetical protein
MQVMMKFALGTTLLFGLLAACGGDDKPTVKLPDGSVEMTCSPTDQTGCPTGQKCTWLIDAVTATNVVGHTGCAPDGTVAAGGDCEFGAPGETGFDNCVKGTVCSDFRQDGMEPHKVCKSICDRQDGTPGCGSDQYCFNYASLFSTGDTTPAAGGICEQACDPMADNDFDGSATASMKTGGKCDADPRIGCYGSLSSGSGTVETQFACVRDRHYNLLQPKGLRHRVACTVDNMCQDPGPKTYTNSCNQGYQPLLRESTMVSTTVCTALCQPDNCFMGACGTAPGDENHVGVFPNRCNFTDRVGEEFHQDGNTTHENGEHCHFLWRAEAGSNGFLPSKYSDTVGYCVDHTKYLYDKDGDGTAETELPACATLPMGFGSGSQQSDPDYWGAADLGCVDTMKAGLQTATGKAMLERALAKQRSVDLPRPLYGAENAF